MKQLINLTVNTMHHIIMHSISLWFKCMVAENNKFALISEIYSQFSEENKEQLIASAQNLLEIQKKNADTEAGSIKTSHGAHGGTEAAEQEKRWVARDKQTTRLQP